MKSCPWCWMMVPWRLTHDCGLPGSQPCSPSWAPAWNVSGKLWPHMSVSAANVPHTVADLFLFWARYLVPPVPDGDIGELLSTDTGTSDRIRFSLIVVTSEGWVSSASFKTSCFTLTTTRGKRRSACNIRIESRATRDSCPKANNSLTITVINVDHDSKMLRQSRGDYKILKAQQKRKSLQM